MLELGGPYGEEGGPRGARERRIARAEEKERVRSAMRSAARHGYYVFDDLTTDEAGMIDYLAVGPPGVFLIPVREEEGRVSLGADGERLLLDGRPFEDDPYRQADELAADASRKLFEGRRDVTCLTCFTKATVEVRDREIPPGTTPLWELPWALDPEGLENLSPAEVEEIAARVERAYGRPPFVRPEREGDT